MVPPAAHKYARAVRSIHQVNPSAPAILGDLDPNRSIARGDPIVPDDLGYAREVVAGLKSKKELGYEVVTEELVTSVELRRSAVEAAHFADSYAPNTIQEFQRIYCAIQVLAQSINRLNTSVLTANKNARIAARNSLCLRHETQPLHKITPSHGYELAQTAEQSLDPAIIAGIVPPPVAPVVGTLPPEFDSNIQDYGHADILGLITFYADDFGITPDDALGNRVEKFHRFLCGR